MKRIWILSLIALVTSCISHPDFKDTTGKKVKKVLTTDSSVQAHPVDYQFDEDSTFSILSWNVEHFVDTYDNPYINNRREDDPPEELTEKVALFVKAIRKANADIILLQEFESESYLMQLAKDSFPEMDYQFFTDAASPNWYMNVVMMSRFPLGVMHAYGDVTTPLPNYKDEEGKKETQSRINTRMWSIEVFPAKDYSFWLTGVHLKAGRGDRDIAMRSGQIDLLQEEFNSFLDRDPKTNILMAGDFNAFPKSKELNQLTSELSGPATLIDVLDTNVFTHPSDSPARRLDYILMNQEMHYELADGSLEVAKFFSNDSMRLISDHLPLQAKFYKRDRDI